MTEIEKLIESYREYIEVPWRADTAAPQRVIFCIYKPQLERALDVEITEFELATCLQEHTWALYNMEDVFPSWLSAHKYREGHFKKPELVSSEFERFLEYLLDDFGSFLVKKVDEKKGVDEKTVVAIRGVSSLFGILKVSRVVDRLAPLVPGRLLVFFPGSYENSNYRFLDGYDGWNYHAVPIMVENE